MSDGLSDANACEEMERSLWRAAEEFRKALARVEHRGWSLRKDTVFTIVNDVLTGSGWQLKTERK